MPENRSNNALSQPQASAKDRNANPLFRRAPDGLTAYQRHKNMMTDYLKFYARTGPTTAVPKPGSSDLDALKSKHRFLRSDADDETLSSSWASRVAKKYYDRLFKEYCLADLSRYKSSQLALRWRTRTEVVSGKGQFSCGNIACTADANLRSWEVNFAYVEDGVRKNALVKVRLCEPCSYKLNYRKIREARKEQKRKRKQEDQDAGVGRGKRRRGGSHDDDSGDDDEKSLIAESQDDAGEPHLPPNDNSSSDSGENDTTGACSDINDNLLRHRAPGEAYTAAEISSIWRAPRAGEAAGDEKTPDDEMDAVFADLIN
ncbi:hypothetical protein HDU87_007398 [Geranomyces variabilis]|uniref:Protein FRA10AC1 n=1 Tax=Geranomyces variabilis TaxID=109894 RepID=A0AAD5XQ75_9FUNG|nr:hypothetical protein HDU87_007398 [Geranomyces variabilis]